MNHLEVNGILEIRIDESIGFDFCLVNVMTKGLLILRVNHKWRPSAMEFFESHFLFWWQIFKQKSQNSNFIDIFYEINHLTDSFKPSSSPEIIFIFTKRHTLQKSVLTSTCLNKKFRIFNKFQYSMSLLFKEHFSTF